MDAEELRKKVLESLEKARFGSSLPIPGLRYAPPDYLEFLSTYGSGSPLIPCKTKDRKVFFMGEELKGENAVWLGLVSVLLDPRSLLKCLENKVTLGEQDGDTLLVGRINPMEFVRRVIGRFSPELTEEQISELYKSIEVVEGLDWDIIFEIGGENQLVAVRYPNTGDFPIRNYGELKKVTFWYEK